MSYRHWVFKMCFKIGLYPIKVPWHRVYEHAHYRFDSL